MNKKKVIIVICGISLFAIGFLIGDSQAVEQANKLKNAYNKGITDHILYYHVDEDKDIRDGYVKELTEDAKKVIDEWND